MSEKTPEYRRTLFDRYGPGASDIIRSGAYGLMIFGLLLGVLNLELGFRLTNVLIAVVGGAFGGGAGMLFGKLAGGAWHQVMYSGASTPYVEQFSRQEALVMQGRVPEALAAYEEVIAAFPGRADVRLKAADLYVSSGADVERAAALFREVQRLPDATTGQGIYASNRLVDLLLGPLKDQGRALVELRRIVHVYPNTRAAEQARVAIAKLKGSSEIQ